MITTPLLETTTTGLIRMPFNCTISRSYYFTTHTLNTLPNDVALCFTRLIFVSKQHPRDFLRTSPFETSLTVPRPHMLGFVPLELTERCATQRSMSFGRFVCLQYNL
jgi:hypothetical protein